VILKSITVIFKLMAAEKSDPNFVRILISYKEYQRLKDIEVQFKKSEQLLQKKLQIPAGIKYI